MFRAGYPAVVVILYINQFMLEELVVDKDAVLSPWIWDNHSVLEQTHAHHSRELPSVCKVQFYMHMPTTTFI